MGRKGGGMKGFIKSAARPSTKPEEEAQGEQQQAGPSGSSSQPPAPAARAQDKQPAAEAEEAEAAGSDEEQSGPETRGQMLKRHKREMLAHKKAMQRMGKKGKDEVAKLDNEIEARHARELQELDAGAGAAAAPAGVAPAAAAAAPGAAPAAAARAATSAAAAAKGVAAADRASKYLKEVTLAADDEAEGEQKQRRPSKAQKRRDKMAARDADREARIAAELSELGPSEREEEEKALKALLAPLGLGIREIRADGHCLYRSVEDQLTATAAAAAAAAEAGGAEAADGEVPNYQELRELAAEHIRQHKEQFAPFLLPEDEAEDPEAHFERYCYDLETTAAWGGHLELTALSAALRRHIRVHAVGMQTVSMGEEFGGDEEGAPPAIDLCYLRHAFGLGEHYNSTKKLRFVRFSLGGEEGEGDEGEGEGGSGDEGEGEGEGEAASAEQQQQQQRRQQEADGGGEQE